MEVSKIDSRVLGDIRERGHTDSDVAQMTARQASDEFCMWNGLINWGDTLFDAVENLKAAEANKK